ncbi:MAG: hypothetical protein KDK27_11340, partial [Leptospiraceae bacterium]|nr:hypothetical protein [Leptospiraceae bacterium]
RIFQYPIYRLPQPGCYGYDGEINVVHGANSMPDLLLVAQPLFNEEGGCWPAANSEAESKEYVASEMERIRGSYRFVFQGYGYQGSEDLKNLRSED